jgi:carbamoyl-phosphate synthase large subunit
VLSGKTIMIFGGGKNQLTLIEAAKNLGVRSVVIDPDDHAPGKYTADYFEVVEPADFERTKAVALKYQVNGIVTSQMENPLVIMAKLALECGYIFPSPQVILQCRNKFMMKQVFVENGIRCAKGILIRPGENIRPDLLNEFTFPLIIKPVDAHSSRGVFKVNDFTGLMKYENQTRSFSGDHSLLIEEFIDGKEYSVESLTYKGKTFIIQITEKIITPYPYTVEIGHIQPAELTAKERTEVEQLVIKAIDALGINNSASHTELKITANGPVIIEIGARLGGDFIASYLTLASTGISMDEGAINIALGYEPEISQKTHKYSCIKYLELPVGKVVKRLRNYEELVMSSGVVYALIYLKEGQIVYPLTDSAKRAGFVIVQGESRSEVINIAGQKLLQLAEYIQLN